MKRIIRLLALLCSMAFLMTGCSILSRPTNLSSICYTAGMSVLETTDAYIEGKITAVDASGKIQDQCRILDSLPEQYGSQDQAVKNYCSILSYTFMLVSEGETNHDNDILSTRNYLADLLGES